MQYRIGIQIISFKKPKYLKQTLDSLYSVISENDKVCVLEQTEDDDLKQECIDICKSYPNIYIIPMSKNLGQRGATNVVYESGFFNDTKYIMLSDHDNLFHEKLDVYCDILDKYPNVWISTGLNSPEHDIENKIDNIVFKSSARAGHMVLRTPDFLSLCPFDLNTGKDLNCSWFCGLDWSISHWGKTSPGYHRTQFIACYSGGVEHIGRESTWQGKYDDEYNLDILNWIRSANLYEIIKKYPPRHTYISGKYWYETLTDEELKQHLNIAVENIPIEEKIKNLLTETLNIKNLTQINIDNIQNMLVIPEDIKEEIKLLPIIETTKVISCTHYYSKNRIDNKYKYTRNLFSLELWRRRIRFNLGMNIPIIVFDDHTIDLNSVIKYLEEPVKVIYIDNDNIDIINIDLNSKFTIYSFNTHLGRHENDFPGWLRSFKSCLKIDADILFFNELDLLTNITFNDFDNIYCSGTIPNFGIEPSIQIISKPIRQLLLDNFNKLSSAPEPDIEALIFPHKMPIIPGSRVDENPNIGLELFDQPTFWIANPSNKHFETYYSKFNISLDIKSIEINTKKIIALNYIWPEYGICFLEKSIQSILPHVYEYHLFLNKYAYTNAEASETSINKVKVICEKNNNLGKIIIHYKDQFCEEEEILNDVRYYFNKLINLTKEYADYIWLVQSDEIYENHNILDVIELCDSGKLEACAITNPICYFDTPYYFVNPIENFPRPSIINVKNFNLDIRLATDITFHHLSYVLTRKELKTKFDNWSHRHQVNLSNFNNVFDAVKTNKKIGNLHPVIPTDYKITDFIDLKINKELFLDYVYYLIDNSNYDEFFNNDLNIFLNRFIVSVMVEMIPSSSTCVGIGASNVFQSLVNIAPKLNIIDFENNRVNYNNLYSNIDIFSETNNINAFYGTYKFLIPHLHNNSIDCVFFNNLNNYNDFETSFIEIYPKLKDFSIMFGIYDKTDINTVNVLNSYLPSNHNSFHNCPWGSQLFVFHEIHLDLINDLEIYKSINLNSNLSIWFARTGEYKNG
jgi:hypothetical protein